MIYDHLKKFIGVNDLKGNYFSMIEINLHLFFLDLFYKFGKIKDIQVVIDKKTNKSRGFGFIYFEEIESATRVKTSFK